MENKRILIFTGNGKGKTTAALGMALRASGHGMRVRIIQFIKNDVTTGEIGALKHLPGVELLQTGCGFIPPVTSPAFARHREAAEKGLRMTFETVRSGDYDLVVLDEICTAVTFGLLADDLVQDIMREVPEGACLVLTGRGATPGMMALADTVTEMNCVKHGLAQGLPSRKGVEY